MSKSSDLKKRVADYYNFSKNCQQLEQDLIAYQSRATKVENPNYATKEEVNIVLKNLEDIEQITAQLEIVKDTLAEITKEILAVLESIGIVENGKIDIAFGDRSDMEIFHAGNKINLNGPISYTV